MSNESGSEFQYIRNCLDSLAQKNYREALKTLGDGIRSQLQSSTELDGQLLLKHMNTVISYLEHRLEEDFGFSVDDENTRQRTLAKRRCSFCGAEEAQKKLVAGPTR